MSKLGADPSHNGLRTFIRALNRAVVELRSRIDALETAPVEHFTLVELSGGAGSPVSMAGVGDPDPLTHTVEWATLDGVPISHDLMPSTTLQVGVGGHAGHTDFASGAALNGKTIVACIRGPRW